MVSQLAPPRQVYDEKLSDNSCWRNFLSPTPHKKEILCYFKEEHTTKLYTFNSTFYLALLFPFVTYKDFSVIFQNCLFELSSQFFKGILDLFFNTLSRCMHTATFLQTFYRWKIKARTDLELPLKKTLYNNTILKKTLAFIASHSLLFVSATVELFSLVFNNEMPISIILATVELDFE